MAGAGGVLLPASGAVRAFSGIDLPAVGARHQTIRVVSEQRGGKRGPPTTRKNGVQMMQQVVGKRFHGAGAPGVGHVWGENGHARADAGGEGLVLGMNAAKRVDLQQALHQQHEEGVPIGVWREDGLPAEVAYAGQVGIEEGFHGHGAGEAAKLVAVYVNPVGDGVAAGGGARKEEVVVVEVADDDAQAM